MRARRPTLLGLAALLLVGIIVAFATEWVTLDRRLTIGELVVGVGTLALASFTWALARQTGQEVDWTRRSVQAAEDNVKLTRQSVESRDKPFVLPTPPVEKMTFATLTMREDKPSEVEITRPIRFESVSAEPDDKSKLRQHWFLRVRLSNVGNGPAIVTRVALTEVGRPKHQILDESEREILIPAPNGYSDQSVQLLYPYRVPEAGSTWRLWITYKDSANIEWVTTSRLEVGDDQLCASMDSVQAKSEELPNRP